MRFGKTLLVCGLIVACVLATIGNIEAQVRRAPALRYRTLQPGTAARTANPGMLQNRELITGKVVQLSPMLEPAVGPSGAQGVASVFYNDVDTSLNSGNIVVTGLPAGNYMAWIVFFDPFTQQKQKIHSELVAQFNVPENAVRTETALTIGLPNVINISHAKQIVVTNWVNTTAQVGRIPVCGAAGYPKGPAAGQAVLAANLN